MTDDGKEAEENDDDCNHGADQPTEVVQSVPSNQATEQVLCEDDMQRLREGEACEDTGKKEAEDSTVREDSGSGNSGNNNGEEQKVTEIEPNLIRANERVRAAMLRQEEILGRKKQKKVERERAWRAKYSG
jgi:hypothetical protein